MEILYKDIYGYGDLYSISTQGVVYSHISNRRLKPRDNGKGYYTVRLYKDRVGKQFKIHRLVAQAFIPNLDNLPVVNHKDGDSINNKVNNLEWCTQAYNMLHGKVCEYAAVANRKSVKRIDVVSGTIKVYSSIREATVDGYNGPSISACCKGKRFTHRGFKWEYVCE